MGTDFEAVRQWLEENEAPKEVKEAFEASPLRTQLEEATKKATTLESQLSEATSKLTRIERKPVLKKSLEQLSVDYDSLPKYGRRAVEGFDWEGDEPDLEKLAEFLEDQGFEVQAQASEAGDQPEAGKIAGQAQMGSDRFFKPDSIQEQIAKAEAAGEWETSRRLKTQLAQERFAKA